MRRLLTLAAGVVFVLAGCGGESHQDLRAWMAAQGKDAKGHPTASINVRCLEGVEPSSLKITPFDGRSR